MFFRQEIHEAWQLKRLKRGHNGYMKPGSHHSQSVQEEGDFEDTMAIYGLGDVVCKQKAKQKH